MKHNPTPIKNPRADQCLFCNSRNCHVRIFGNGYDEVACRQHVKNLERHKDETRPGLLITHQSSTAKLRRGK